MLHQKRFHGKRSKETKFSPIKMLNPSALFLGSLFSGLGFPKRSTLAFPNRLKIKCLFIYKMERNIIRVFLQSSTKRMTVPISPILHLNKIA